MSLATGAARFLQNYSGKKDPLHNVRAVAAWQFRILADVLRRVVSVMRAPDRMKKTSEHHRLTQREPEILKPFAQGLSCAKITEVWGNQPLTVRNAICGI